MKSTTSVAALLTAFFASAAAFPTYTIKRQSNGTAVGPIGFGAGTTGGGSAAAVTVSSCADLEAAIAGEEAKVVQIDGVVADCGTLEVGSNTSLLGVGAESGASGTGFRIKDSTNIIIQNLKIGPPPAKADAIDVESSTQIWVDHCELFSVGLTGGKDDFDGLFDAKRGSDNLEVSYTKFYDHFKGSLIGHSDSNADQDTGKLRITYHHNSFVNVGSRLPSLRFGTGHIFNSVFQDCPTSGINSRMGAQVLAENNVFDNVDRAIVTNLDSDEPGFACDKGNVLSGTSTVEITQECSFAPEYDYTLDGTDGLIAAIEASAGTGKI
ncbi:hypothetical protein INS49_004568 [Diaporthe citri]|uniref:uncharacterized protein n=1 Tax=Diaporthe citri TaxID=83186 RepID=UPI001C82684B|nr:uncharacterized protein INS49_004568 [Diaporthe citri]KAG6354551.1 hypothetical protein INS49_004568 [Diaporthe citri]